MLHRDHGLQTADRGSGSHFQSDLLIGGVLKVKVCFLADLKELFRNLGRGSSGIAGCKGDTRFQGPARNGLIAKKEHLLSRSIFK